MLVVKGLTNENQIEENYLMDDLWKSNGNQIKENYLMDDLWMIVIFLYIYMFITLHK